MPCSGPAVPTATAVEGIHAEHPRGVLWVAACRPLGVRTTRVAIARAVSRGGGVARAEAVRSAPRLFFFSWIQKYGLRFFETSADALQPKKSQSRAWVVVAPHNGLGATGTAAVRPPSAAPRLRGRVNRPLRLRRRPAGRRLPRGGGSGWPTPWPPDPTVTAAPWTAAAPALAPSPRRRPWRRACGPAGADDRGATGAPGSLPRAPLVRRPRPPTRRCRVTPPRRAAANAPHRHKFRLHHRRRVLRALAHPPRPEATVRSVRAPRHHVALLPAATAATGARAGHPRVRRGPDAPAARGATKVRQLPTPQWAPFYHGGQTSWWSRRVPRGSPARGAHSVSVSAGRCTRACRSRPSRKPKQLPQVGHSKGRCCWWTPRTCLLLWGGGGGGRVTRGRYSRKKKKKKKVRGGGSTSDRVARTCQRTVLACHRASAASKHRQGETLVSRARVARRSALVRRRPTRPARVRTVRSNKAGGGKRHRCMRVHVPIAHFPKSAVAQVARKRAHPVVHRPLVLPAGPRASPQTDGQTTKGTIHKRVGNNKRSYSKVSACPPRPRRRPVAPPAPATAGRAAAFDRLGVRPATGLASLPPLISNARVRRRHRRGETAWPPPRAAPPRHPDNSCGRPPPQIKHQAPPVTHHGSYRQTRGLTCNLWRKEAPRR